MFVCVMIINFVPEIYITAGINEDDVDDLQSMDNIDPEVRPGLFQGDMALNNEVYPAVYITIIFFFNKTFTIYIAVCVCVCAFYRFSITGEWVCDGTFSLKNFGSTALFRM